MNLTLCFERQKKVRMLETAMTAYEQIWLIFSTNEYIDGHAYNNNVFMYFTKGFYTKINFKLNYLQLQ